MARKKTTAIPPHSKSSGPTARGWFPIDPDAPKVGKGARLFGNLNADAPLLLLPTRLETRYRTDLTPPELRIRIYPDQVHVDADTPQPGRSEYRFAVEFWRQWYMSSDATTRQAAWTRFFSQVGERRAGYLARLLKPQRSGKQLTFPKFEDRDRHRPAKPRLLPRRWIALGYLHGRRIFQESSNPIAKGLRVGPDPKAGVWSSEDSGLEIDDGLAWMVDYQRAIGAGMAITVRLTGDAAAALDKVSRLLVVGIDTDYDETDLEQLLDVHSRTGGFGFVRQGTATNNLELNPSGWSNRPPTGDEDMDRELAESRKADGNSAELGSALGFADLSVLKRAQNGRDLERHRSRSAVAALFESVLGAFLRQLLDVGTANGLSTKAVNDARRWCIKNVTGGAPLPTIRIGPQPYGILPVMRSRSVPGSAVAGTVESVLSEVVDEWRVAASGLATLNPNDTDVAGGQAHVENIGRVLAAQPHPARLFTRKLDNYDELNVIEKLFTPQAYYAAALAGMDPDINQNIESPQLEMAFFYGILINNIYPGITLQSNTNHDVTDQISLWEEVSEQTEEYLRSTGKPVEANEAVDLCDAVISVLTSYEERQRPLRSLGLPLFDGRLGMDNTALVQGVFHRDAVEWGDLGVVETPDAVQDGRATDYLADLKRRFDSRNGSSLGASSLPAEFHDAEPLLYQLLDSTLGLVPSGQRMELQVSKALNTLAAMEVDELEWLTRETIGLGTHRIDAWHTGLAAERLTDLRKDHPSGLNIGAYGWVTDLEPRADRRLSQGFIHAPSMAHATTASILRAGWQSHGTADPSSAAAVDLRSDRIRTATWLLDGIRQGQDLGDLLGHRFERILHDTNGDRFIRDVREWVLEAQNEANTDPDQPVDGIILLDLWRDGALPGLPSVVRRALRSLAATFDAVNDVGLFEAVHQLTLGNHERATAMLDTMTTGVSTPPELRGPRSTRQTTGVEHRVVVLMPRTGSVGGGWVPGVRDAVSPGVERWLADLLPPAASIGFTSRESDGGFQTLTLADLQLSALDAISLIGEDPNVPGQAIGTLVSALHHAGRPVMIEPRGGTVDLAEFAVLAIELRRSLARWRSATARDLCHADDQGTDAVDFSAERIAVMAALAELDRTIDQLHDQITNNGDPTADRVTLARFGLAIGAEAGDLKSATALHARCTSRLRLLDGVPANDEHDQQPLRERASALFGSPLPLLGSFTIDQTDRTPIGVSHNLATEPEIDDWLDAVGRVRSEVSRLTTINTLSGLLTDHQGFRAAAGQYPRASGELWAAIYRPPADTGGRTSLVVVGSARRARPAVGRNQTVSAMFVDQWSERIPSDETTTGLAFQFDAPSNRPPQSWLLAVRPEEEEKWSLRLVADTLLETLEWAELRTVGPEDLGDFGRAIPTVIAPGYLTHLPDEDAT